VECVEVDAVSELVEDLDEERTVVEGEHWLLSDNSGRALRLEAARRGRFWKGSRASHAESNDKEVGFDGSEGWEAPSRSGREWANSSSAI
jgi:hypothetical protein